MPNSASQGQILPIVKDAPNMTSTPKLKRRSRYRKRIYSAPTVINLEITEACNLRCRHCYNPWRIEHMGQVSLTKERFDYLLDEFVRNKVFHVILSGGEPFAKFDLLTYAIEKLRANDISVSCNSNLTLATPKKIAALLDVGLDHILTSWYSFISSETEFITQTENAQDKVINGIKTAVDGGMRVSVNTICTQNNKGSIYNSGKFLHSIGAYQFIAHRVIPPAYDRKDENQEHFLSPQDALDGLDELLRLREDTGMLVGTLISYPLCLLGDLEKYADFVGRGCPTQSGHRFSVSANGATHGCVMEDKDYGDIFEVGLREVYARTRPWQDESYLYEGCLECEYIDVCQSGCRMDAFAASGRMDGRDPLMLGKEHIIKPYRHIENPQVIEKIEQGATFNIPSRLRFRQEDGFWLLNIRWGNTIEIENPVAELLRKYLQTGESFSLADCSDEVSVRDLANLLYKDALESPDIPLKLRRKGVSIDPAKLPESSFVVAN